MTNSASSASIRSFLDSAAARLRAAGINSARREAEWLMEHVTGRTRLQLLMAPADELNHEEVRELEGLLVRRVEREPLQYLIGEAGFFGHLFRVRPSVLIPRPETEMLVEWVLDRGDLASGVLDLGTGSGCIPISVHLARPEARCTGVDISPEALLVARENAQVLGAGVTFVQADMLAPGLGKAVGAPFSIVVSNPPYIGEEEAQEMQPEVVAHEPHSALFAKGDALQFYRHLARAAVDLLVDGGWICLEVHADRGGEVVRLLEDAGWKSVQLQQDLAGRDRMVCARRPD